MGNQLNEAAEQVYNSYLLLHKLNELKIDGGEPLNDVISKAINDKKEAVEFTVDDKQYKIQITKENSNYKLEVLSEHIKPEVKDVLEYTDKEIIALWANSTASLEKDLKNNWAFAVNIQDEIRKKDLKIGGLGKKVPFSLRFANFYKVIEILKDETKPLEERLRLANNIATGSGKTGDIALLKFWAYLVDLPCITIVPSDHLKAQSNKFDQEFLPDEVAEEFAKPLYEKKTTYPVINNKVEEVLEEKYNTKYATTTFKEALDTHWNKLNDIYGKDDKKPALICIDEAPKLKENAVLMARAIEIAKNNSVAIFSATPDHFLSDEFKIKQQILLSPKEREALGIGKLPVVCVAKKGIYSTSHRINNLPGNIYANTEEQYVHKYENTHVVLDKKAQELKKINPDKEKLSQLSLDFIDQTLDSQAYKIGLIASEKKYHNRDDYIKDIVSAIAINKAFFGENLESKRKNREEERKKSFISSIKKLNTGLSDEKIGSFVIENLNTSVGSRLLSSIKLHNIIDTFNEYRQSGEAVANHKVSEFIKKKYDIAGALNLELTKIILELDKIYQKDTKLQKNFDRNYEGDKNLHDHILQNLDIKKFCEKDAVISYFDGKVRRFNAQGVESKIPEDDKENVLNFAKAGFVPRIISKELAIGIDAPRLGQTAIIATEISEILDPNFLLQFIGRVGRDVSRKGKCYVDSYIAEQEYIDLKYKIKLSQLKKESNGVPLYPDSIPEEYRNWSIVPVEVTNQTVGGIATYRYVDKKYMYYETPTYLDLENINTLSGKEFFDVIEKGYEKYYNDEINIFSVYSSLLSESVCSVIRQHLGTQHSKKYIYEKSFKSIKDVFRTININFNYDQKRVLDIFYRVLMQQTIPRSDEFNPDDITSSASPQEHHYSQYMASFVIEKFKSAIKKEMAIEDGNATVIPKYSDNIPIEDLARYTVHSKPMSCAELITQDPNSNAPIFVKQKEILQNVAVNVSQNSKPSSNNKTIKVVMCVAIVASFIAVGIYAATGKNNPIIATEIFFGVAIAAAISCYAILKISKKVSEDKDLGVGTLIAPIIENKIDHRL